MKADPIEPNTIKQVQRLFQEKKLNDLQRRMTVLRSKWLYGDFESSLSFQAMKVYEESVKLNKRMLQQNDITRYVNNSLCLDDQNNK